jgi:hypothetical protein
MRGNLVRRLLVSCALVVTVLAAFAALRANRVTTVSAAGTPGVFKITAIPIVSGCPLGPSFTFCDQIPNGTTQLVEFNVTATAAVQGVSVSVAAIPGLSANFAAGDFTVPNFGTCTGNLAVNQICILPIVFSPTVAGLREAVVTVTDTAGDTLTLNVNGTGTNLRMLLPNTPVCPPALPTLAFTYCNQPVGGVSGTLTFTLTSGSAVTGLNVGIAAVPGLESQFNQAMPDFTIENTTCTGSLAAFTPCTIGVAFTPATAGLRSASLTITDSDSDALAVTLAGNTSAAVTVEYLPAAIQTCLPSPGAQFCNEPTAGTTASIPLVLKNTSGTQITGLTITPAVLNNNTNPPPPPVNFTVMSTSCTSTLAANATCTINVAFTPQATGLQQGSVSVTDTQGDVAAFNLSGVGDDFSMAIVAGQSPEVSVAQGGTATFKAQLNDDAIFGQNGEQVKLACPINLPQFTNCSFTPCPITPVFSGNVPFSLVIVTSSSTVQAPEIPNPCDTTAANVAPGTRGPIGVLRVLNTQPNVVPQFPALLAILALVTLMMGALGFGAFGALPGRGLAVRRALVALALIVFSGALLTACKKKYGGTGGGGSTATPLATTTMNVVASAVDSNGNPINAGRGMQITLDVIKGP